MARISWELVSNNDQSKETTVLAQKGITSSTTGLYFPAVHDTTRKH